MFIWFYPGQWRPFRASIIIAIFLSLISIPNSGKQFSLDLLLIYFITWFFILLILLYLGTIIFKWVIPPQKGAEGVWKDWWKP